MMRRESPDDIIGISETGLIRRKDMQSIGIGIPALFEIKTDINFGRIAISDLFLLLGLGLMFGGPLLDVLKQVSSKLFKLPV